MIALVTGEPALSMAAVVGLRRPLTRTIRKLGPTPAPALDPGCTAVVARTKVNGVEKGKEEEGEKEKKKKKKKYLLKLRSRKKLNCLRK